MSKCLFWVANWDLSREEAAARLGGNVHDMGDSTGTDCRVLAGSSLRKVAGYITGGGGIAWSPNDFATFPRRTFSVVTIDQQPDFTWRGGNVKDLEQGAGTPLQGAQWAREAIQHGLVPTLYMSEAWVGPVNEALARLGLPQGQIVAYQWASPSSNPHTILPGTNLTLKEANVDLSVTAPLWYPIPTVPSPKPGPAPKPVPLTHDQQVFDWAFNIGYHAGWTARG